LIVFGLGINLTESIEPWFLISRLDRIYVLTLGPSGTEGLTHMDRVRRVMWMEDAWDTDPQLRTSGAMGREREREREE
jgi:hypothetical protein